MIPKVFHRIWIGGPEPDEFKRWGESWGRLHPGWIVKTWDERALVPSAFPDLLNQCPRISDQVDILRYELLEREGGVYLDADMECLKNIEPLIEGAEAFVARHDDDPKDIYAVNTSIIGAPAGHPFVADLVDTLVSTNSAVALTAGPEYITAIVKRHPSVRIFNRKLFQPYRWDQLERKGWTFPDAYAVHHWTSKRFKSPPPPKFDVPETVLRPAPDPEARLRYAVDVADSVPGWMGRPELAWLARSAAKCRVVVEFGTFHGRSAKAMALAGAGKVFCIDVFNWTSELNPRMGVWEAAHKNLYNEVGSTQVSLIKMMTQPGASALLRAGVKADMVFIDACHDYGAVLRDILDGIKLLGGKGSGGLLCGHDFNPEAYPGVVRAVKELVPGYELPTDGQGWIWSKRI